LGDSSTTSDTLIIDMKVGISSGVICSHCGHERIDKSRPGPVDSGYPWVRQASAEVISADSGRHCDNDETEYENRSTDSSGFPNQARLATCQDPVTEEGRN
jgi:hypothetical protein